MLFADTVLARRIEAAEAATGRGCAAHQPGAAFLEAGGGVAFFLGPDSPLTHAVGMGLNGPVRVAELDAVEAFFRSRGARVTIDLCPLTDPAFLAALAERGYHPSEFNNVLVKPLAGMEIGPAPKVRLAGDEECDVWARTVGQGFFEQDDLTEDEINVGRAIFSMPGARCYLAVADSGENAGGGALAVNHGLATLFADSTIARFRRQGLHLALISVRLREALAQGCDLATASTLPGSASQRNYERMGFRVVYTKIVMVG